MATIFSNQHRGQHGAGCPGCVVCPTCKRRVADHDLDDIIACSNHHEAKRAQRREAEKRS